MSQLFFTAITREPEGAFFYFHNVPEYADKQYKTQHKFSPGGLKSAVKRVQTSMREYKKSHGNIAACSGWVLSPWGEEISLENASRLAETKFTTVEEARKNLEEILKIYS